VTGTGKRGRAAACAAALTAVAALAAGCTSSGYDPASTSLTTSLPTQFGPPEKTTLNVGVVPAMDSAGFFVALRGGLFAREGLTVKYTPAASAETAVAQQLAGHLDISAGNYVSYINAAATGHAPIEVIAEGSVVQQGAQTLFTMPNSKIKSLAQLKGHLIGVNAPGNIDYLLGVSVLQQNGVAPQSVNFPKAPIALPAIGGQLASGKIAAAIMPEPFASQAEQEYGAVPLADLNQGATAGFPVAGYVATKQWARQNPNTLKRFLAALEVGQEVSDVNRGAVEQAFEDIGSAQDGKVTPAVASVMALGSYPIGINASQIQRVADVMFQYTLLKSPFKVSSMLMPSGTFNFAQFSAGA
jgi:NitT/TauT family transport system substrate-binding protein